MLDKILGVRHAVALDEWSVRVFRIRPPVITFRKEIMEPAGAARSPRCCDRYWLPIDISARGAQPALLFEDLDIEDGLGPRRRSEDHEKNNDQVATLHHCREITNLASSQSACARPFCPWVGSPPSVRRLTPFTCMFTGRVPLDFLIALLRHSSLP